MGESSEISWDAWETLRYTGWELGSMHTCKFKGIACDIGTLIIISRMLYLIYFCKFVHLSQQFLYFVATSFEQVFCYPSLRPCRAPIARRTLRRAHAFHAVISASATVVPLLTTSTLYAPSATVPAWRVLRSSHRQLRLCAARRR